MSAVEDRFELRSCIGQGGMGEVWRARDRLTGADVAVKILLRSTERARFAREADLLATVEHPGIVRYIAHAAGFLAMEWLDGIDLAARLARGPLPTTDVEALAQGIAGALAHAHARGIVHRDLKPSNIFLVDSDAARAKVLDFGVALDPRSRLTRDGTIVGTPGFMAPEQVRGSRVGPEADVFSLGCVLFECLTGRAAFDGATPLAVLSKVLLEEPPRLSAVAGVPPRIAALVDRMLAKEPSQRPTAEEVARLGDAPTGVPSGRVALGARELALVSVIVVGSLDMQSAATLAAETAYTTSDVVANVVRAAGARLEPVLGGALAVLVSGTGEARDQVVSAARCALVLRTVYPDAPIVLVTGRGLAGERMPVGEAIDRAVATMARTGPRDGVRIDALTAGLLAGRFIIEEECLRGEREGALGGTVLGKRTRFVGRDRDVVALDVEAETVLETRRGRAVVVAGPAGVGKSRLVSEWLATFRGRHPAVAVWTGAADPMSAGSALALLRQTLRRACGIRSGKPEDARTAWERLGRFAAGTSEGSLAFLGEILGLPRVQSEAMKAAQSDGSLMASNLKRAFSDLVRVHTAETPLVCVLDDLHWGDRSTVALLHEALGQHAMLVVATARPEGNAMYSELSRGHLCTIDLDRLADDDGENLVRSVLGTAAETTVARIVAQAAGNVLHLEELMRAESSGRHETPETVVAMVQARLVRLSADQRRVVRAASIFGDGFWENCVAVLAGDIDVTPIVASLVGEEVFVRVDESRLAGERELRFRHPLMREAAYGTLVDEDRALGHRMAAEWLEQVGVEDALLLALHFEKGELPLRAAASYLEAARAALDTSDFESAIAWAERGIAAGAGGRTLGELRVTLADARHWSGDLEGGLATGRAALGELEPGSARWWEACAIVARALARTSRTDELDAMARQLAARKTTPGARVPQALALARMAFALLMASRDQAATLAAERARLELTRGAGDALLEAHLEQTHAARAMMTGDLEESIRAFEAAAHAFARAGDDRRNTIASVNAVWARFAIGDYETARVDLERARALGERVRLGGVVVTAVGTLSIVLLRLGDEAGALRTVREALKDGVSVGDARAEGGAREYFADVMLHHGDLAGAEEQARIGLGVLEDVPAARPHIEACLARVLLAKGAVAEALEHARSAASYFETGGKIEGNEVAVLLTYVRALRAAGDIPAARSTLRALAARVGARRDAIRDPRLRACFEGVPENRDVMRLARELDPTAGGHS